MAMPTTRHGRQPLPELLEGGGRPLSSMGRAGGLLHCERKKARIALRPSGSSTTTSSSSAGRAAHGPAQGAEGVGGQEAVHTPSDLAQAGWTID